MNFSEFCREIQCFVCGKRLATVIEQRTVMCPIEKWTGIGFAPGRDVFMSRNRIKRMTNLKREREPGERLVLRKIERLEVGSFEFDAN